MKLNVNFLKWPVLALSLSFFTSSCNLFEKDDPKPASNAITYNNTQYNLEKSLMIKYGGHSLYGSNDTHSINHYYIANGNIDYNNRTGNVDEIMGSFAVFAELVSAGGTEFKNGTFNYIDSSNDNSLTDTQLEAKYKNKSIFSDVEVYIDTNGDGMLAGETPVEANGGTIKVSGSNNTYTLEFNLTLTNGKTLKGKNASSFTPING